MPNLFLVEIPFQKRSLSSFLIIDVDIRKCVEEIEFPIRDCHRVPCSAVRAGQGQQSLCGRAALWQSLFPIDYESKTSWKQLKHNHFSSLVSISISSPVTTVTIVGLRKPETEIFRHLLWDQNPEHGIKLWWQLCKKFPSLLDHRMFKNTIYAWLPDFKLSKHYFDRFTSVLTCWTMRYA